MERVVLEGDGFTLRPVEESDAEDYVQNVQDELIFRYIRVIPEPYELKDAKSFIEDCKEKWRKSESFQFGVVISGEVVGSIGLKMRGEEEDELAELGYWIGREYRGEGVMSEAVELLLDFGFSELSLHKIMARVYEENMPSRKLLEKLGFRREGLLREHEFHKGKFFDTVYYGLLRREWKG